MGTKDTQLIIEEAAYKEYYDLWKHDDTELEFVQKAFTKGANFALGIDRWISVEERLPEEGQYAMIFLPEAPWIDDKAEDKHKIRVARFIRGKESPGRTITGADVHGNNLVPYCWDEFGPSKHFGQDVSHWQEIKPPALVGKEEPAGLSSNKNLVNQETKVCQPESLKDE